METVATREYFEGCREHLLQLVPSLAGKSVLELGCGLGRTLARAKELGASRCVGVEYVREIASEAAENPAIDQIYAHDLNFGLPSIGNQKFNVVIASHVLEHLQNPWKLLRELQSHISKDGLLIGEVPNVRHLSVLIPLIFRDEFVYQEEGILDRTHLRFFTAKTLLTTVTSCGYECSVLRARTWGGWSRVLNAVSLGLANRFFAFAYCFVASPRL
jgi:2-polyprenyl-3-methyl-5-hydroxy-6-metoxy-1,4-benzoquinol methylase